jgi:MULE transposase domain
LSDLEDLEDDEKSSCLLPPLTDDYPASMSNKEVLGKLNSLCVDLGISLVIQRSDSSRGTMMLACSRGQKYKSHRRVTADSRCRKNTNTRRVECPVRIQAKQTYDKWQFEIKCSQHNHKPSDTAASHPKHRIEGLPANQKQHVEELLASSNIPPRTARLQMLEKFPDFRLTQRDLYNIRARLRRDKLGGQSAIQSLFNEIYNKDSDVIVRHEVDKDNNCTQLLLVNKDALKVYADNSDIIQLDCTYKTNRYGMPLLSILGPTKLHTTMVFGFCFLPNEKEESYK